MHVYLVDMHVCHACVSRWCLGWDDEDTDEEFIAKLKEELEKYKASHQESEQQRQKNAWKNSYWLQIS